MTGRSKLPYCAPCALLALLFACSRSEEAPAERPAGAPDVVIVLVDTLRADFTELGGRTGTSPQLAELATESVVFESASSPAPWTLPSVTSLFTGRHLAEHGVLHDRLRLPDSATTLAEQLSEAGFRTASYHRNPYAGERFGLHQGFDRVEQRDGSTGAEHLRDFWREVGEAPYLLYVHNTEPHDLLLVRERFRRGSDPAFLEEYARRVRVLRTLTRVDFAAGREVGATDNTAEQQAELDGLDALRPEVLSLYEASVRDADERIGSIVDALRERGSWNRTLFIVVSDHGEEMGEHEGWQHDQSVYQELVHVPLLVRFPDARHGGRRVRRPVSLVDLLPTILEVAGLEDTEQEHSGLSLLRQLEEEAQPLPRLVSMRHNRKKYFRPFKESRGDLNLVVRQGRWKAIVNLETDGVELYDLDEDPGEQDDLARREPERATELERFARARHEELRARSTPAAPGGPRGASTEALRALRDLGYVGDE